MALKYQRGWVLRFYEKNTDEEMLWVFSTGAECWKKLAVIVRARWESAYGRGDVPPSDEREMISLYFDFDTETFSIREVS